MEFLANAIFATPSSTTVEGAMITHFDPMDYLDRAYVQYYPMTELASEYPKMQPVGFALRGNNLLESDTNLRHVVPVNLLTFLQEACKNMQRKEYDITDLVLYGIQNNGGVVPNWERCNIADPKNTEEPALIPFNNYRVSDSSLNIYAPYALEDGTFKTHSMLQVEDGSGLDFYCLFPSEVDMSNFSSFCTQVGVWEEDEYKMIVYKVHSWLKEVPANVGEGFLNFLAYNVARYSIGRRIAQSIIKTDRYTEESPKKPKETAERQKPPRRSKNNVSIIHQFSEPLLKEVLDLMKDPQALANYLRMCPEAQITYEWLLGLRQLDQQLPMSENATRAEKTINAAMTLLVECKNMYLKYALELLTHRYYIVKQGSFNDSIPLVLHGGGVFGQSVKRVTSK